MKQLNKAAQWTQVKLFLPLLIWIADCTQLPSKRVTNNFFGLFGSVFKTEYETIFGFQHTPIPEADRSVGYDIVTEMPQMWS